MLALIIFSIILASTTASVIPAYGYGTGWGDYGHHHHHHVPVATSYSSVWKVDHSVPVVVKPVVAPVVKTYPSYGFAAWDHDLLHHHHHDHLPYGYGHDHLHHHLDHYGHY